MKGISIILCCYNSAKRLPETLAHLAKQQVSFALNWEVIVVNNNSTDDTVTVARELWKTLGAPTSLQIIDEPQPGLSFAREKGGSIAKYEILLWCDDDNWLCDKYLQSAFDIMEEDLHIGALGGWCEATFEDIEPKWFETYAKYFAVTKQGKRSGDITLKKGCVYGAGMVIRKSHNLELKSLGFSHLLKGRTGASLSSGEDTEYCYAMRLLGRKIWFDERLYFKHYMEKNRMKIDYVTRVRKAITYSNFVVSVYLDELNGKLVTKKIFFKKFISLVRKKIIRQSFKRVFGSFEQKEVAKEYFRNLNILAFSYKEYNENRKSIAQWLPKIINEK